MGAFNSCDCWGRSLFTDYVAIPLDTTDEYVYLGRTIYPSILVPVLGFQVAFCVGVLFWYWRGIRLMRWKDTAGETLWGQIQARGGDPGRAEVDAPRQYQQATPPGSVAHDMDATNNGAIALRPVTQAGSSQSNDRGNPSGRRGPPQEPGQEQPPNQQPQSPPLY